MDNKSEIYVDGNNGGDYIYIKDLKDGQVKLEVGSSCVNIINKEVPVEFITGILDNTLKEYNGDINKIIETFSWDKEFRDELKNKVK